MLMYVCILIYMYPGVQCVWGARERDYDLRSGVFALKHNYNICNTIVNGRGWYERYEWI